MLNLKQLKNFEVLGGEETLGEIIDFYFDNYDWTVRYLVVETGEWLNGRRVLISPFALADISLEDEFVQVSLDREHIANSPDFDVNLPLSREQEQELHSYYEWPLYWSVTTDEALGAGSLAANPLADLAAEMRQTQEAIARGDLDQVDTTPASADELVTEPDETERIDTERLNAELPSASQTDETIEISPGGVSTWEGGKETSEENIVETEAGPRLADLGAHATEDDVVSASVSRSDEDLGLRPAEGSFLRSFDRLAGFKILARDGEIGRLDDFIVENEAWNIFYLIVDTGGIFSGKKVIVSPQWVDHIDWDGQKIAVDLKRETVEHSPQLEEGRSIDRDFETAVYDHFGKHPYWDERGESRRL